MPTTKPQVATGANETEKRRPIRMGEIALAMAERQSQRHPSFSVSQVKAVGGATVIEWDVQVPVCDEFPTAQDAFDAATEYADELLKMYPPPVVNGNGGKS